MAGEAVALQVEGLAKFRRDVKDIERTLPRELNREMKGAAERTVLPVARSLVPVRTGALRDSLRVAAAGSRVSIRSRLPQANVVHWGGTTGPGHRPGVGGSGSVHIKPSLFALKAGEQQIEAFAQALADALDVFFGEHGFK